MSRWKLTWIWLGKLAWLSWRSDMFFTFLSESFSGGMWLERLWLFVSEAPAVFWPYPCGLLSSDGKVILSCSIVASMFI